MLTLEKYIEKRLKEDEIDIYNIKKKIENIQYCTNYIFEYFNTYIDITSLEKAKLKQDSKLMKYQKELDEYPHRTQKWLLEMYKEHKNKLHKGLRNELDEYPEYLLFSCDSDFRKLSYKIYGKISKKI